MTVMYTYEQRLIDGNVHVRRKHDENEHRLIDKDHTPRSTTRSTTHRIHHYSLSSLSFTSPCPSPEEEGGTPRS